MDRAKQKAGPAESLSNAEKQANKRRTNKVRRQFDQSYLDPDSPKSDLVTGAGLDSRRVEHPEDLGQESHMRFNPDW